MTANSGVLPLPRECGLAGLGTHQKGFLLPRRRRPLSGVSNGTTNSKARARADLQLCGAQDPQCDIAGSFTAPHSSRPFMSIELPGLRVRQSSLNGVGFGQLTAIAAVYCLHLARPALAIKREEREATAITVDCDRKMAVCRSTIVCFQS